MSDRCPRCDHDTRIRYLGQGILVPCPECGRGRPLSNVDIDDLPDDGGVCVRKSIDSGRDWGEEVSNSPADGGKWAILWFVVILGIWLLGSFVVWVVV